MQSVGASGSEPFAAFAAEPASSAALRFASAGISTLSTRAKAAVARWKGSSRDLLKGLVRAAAC